MQAKLEDSILSQRLAGRLALVTGASAGIGRACALALAREGAEVIVTGRRKDRLDALAEAVPGHRAHFRVVPGDLADSSFVRRLIDAASAADILVNNAGILTYAPFLEIKPEECEAMFRVNVLAPMHLCQGVGAAMAARRRGHVIMITSLGARTVNRFGVAYAATKHALSAIAKGMRLELKAFGVRVTEIAPGMVDTEIRESSTHPDVVAAIEARKFAPLRPGDVADAVIYATTADDNCSADLIELRPREA